MNWLILPFTSKATLDAINATNSDRAISPVTTIDGTLLVGADALGDAFWSDYQELLSSLSPFVGTPNFPTSPE